MLALAEPLIAYGIPALIGGYSAASKAKEQGQGLPQQILAGIGGGGLGLGLSYGGGKVFRMAGNRFLGLTEDSAIKGGMSVAQKADLLGKLKMRNAVQLAGTQIAPMLAAPLATGAAAGASEAVGGTLPTAAGAAATYGNITGQPQGPQDIPPIPADVTANRFSRPQDMYDFTTGTTAQNRYNSYLDARQNMALAVENARMQQPFMEAAKKAELSRQLAAAQVRSNIAINADQLLSGLHTAQAMGLNSQNQLGNALTQQYQYG